MFRSVLPFVALRRALLVWFCLAAAPSADVRAEDWPRWRGPRGDGTWHAPPLADQWPDDGLKTVWKSPVGGGYAGVSVAGKHVVVLDRQKTPREVERILCLDADDGHVVWSHSDPVEYGKLDYGSGPRAAATIHDGKVYTVGAVGQMNCLDLATGRVVWSTHFQKDRFGRLQEWGYSGSPLIHENLVIVQPGADHAGSVVALNRETGATVWSALSDQAGYATPILISVGADDSGDKSAPKDVGTDGPANVATQLICWTPSHIRALDPRRGTPLWSVAYPVTYGVSIATPVFHRGLVVVCGYWEGSKAIAPKPDGTASLAWEENRFLRGLMSQPLCRGEHVYLLDKQYGLTCFELSTGKKLWDDAHALTPRGRNPHASLVSLAGTDQVLALNANGELVRARITPEGYEELSRAKILGETWAHPAFSGNRVYARSDSELVCVELPTK